VRFRGVQPQTTWQYPPIFRTGATGGATGSTIPIGQTWVATGPAVFGVTTSTTTILDLTSLAPMPTKVQVPQGLDDWSPNPVGHRIMLQPDGDNIYIAFADNPTTLGSLGPTATTTISATFQAITPFTQTGPTGSGCMKLINGTVYGPYEIPLGSTVGAPNAPVSQDNADLGAGKYSPARYLGFVAGTTSAGVFLRIWPASD
jgi:hypothetical protein